MRLFSRHFEQDGGGAGGREGAQGGRGGRRAGGARAARRCGRIRGAERCERHGWRGCAGASGAGGTTSAKRRHAGGGAVRVRACGKRNGAGGVGDAGQYERCGVVVRGSERRAGGASGARRTGSAVKATGAKQRHTSQRTARCWKREGNGANTLFRKYARKSPKYPDVTRQTVLSAVFSLVLFNNIDNIVE